MFLTLNIASQYFILYVRHHVSHTRVITLAVNSRHEVTRGHARSRAWREGITRPRGVSSRDLTSNWPVNRHGEDFFGFGQPDTEMTRFFIRQFQYAIALCVVACLALLVFVRVHLVVFMFASLFVYFPLCFVVYYFHYFLLGFIR